MNFCLDEDATQCCFIVVPLYCDTPTEQDGAEFAPELKFKVHLTWDRPNALVPLHN